MIIDILKSAVEESASDVFVAAGRRITFKKNGVIDPRESDAIRPQLAE